MRNVGFNDLLKCDVRSMKCMVLVVISLVFCQHAWGYKEYYNGKAWDEVVSESDRPSNISTGNDGNYVVHIKTDRQMAWYAWKLRNESNDTERKKYAHATVYLDQSINMSGYSWRGIGERCERFAGTFDGQGYTISYLHVERYNGDHGAGLFDYLEESCTVKNIKFSYCTAHHTDEFVGIVAGGVCNTSDVTFSNLTFENCTVSTPGQGAGFVLGIIESSTSVVFDNIIVKSNCQMKEGSLNYGGIVGIIGWGDDQVTVKNSYISLRVGNATIKKRAGGIAGFMDHGSTLTVDNCVIDLTEGFFNKDDEGGIVGIWCDSSKPKASHTLIIANPDFSKIDNNTGLFAGYSESSSNMELSNCFIHSTMSTYLSKYHIVSEQIATRSSGKCEVNDMMSLDCIGTSAKVAGNIVKMNRKGACYGIGSEFIMPLTSDEGKLVGFSGKSYISKASGGVNSDYTISPDHSFVVMAKGKNMAYETIKWSGMWIVADNTTKMSDKKRTGSWSFAGKPTDDEGQFDFAFSPRPVIKWIDDYPKYDQTSQRVTLKWDVSSSRFAEDWKGHGKWVIKKNDVIVKELDSQEKMEWTDIDPSGNGKITYSVFFVSDEYYYSAKDNEVYPSYTLTPVYSINLKSSTPKVNNEKVINTVQIPNAQCLNGSRVRLLRWDTSLAEKTGNNIAEILKRADDLTVFTEEFHNNPQKEESTLTVTNEQMKPEAFYCTSYNYMWVIDNISDSHFSGKTFTTNILMLTNTNDVTFKEFTATKGKSTSKTTLKWTVTNPDNLNMKYIIYRNSYDKDDTSSPDTWTQVYEVNSGLTSGSFDDEVLPGYVYRYCIRAYPFCEGTASRMNVASEMYDIGFAASRGTIQGRVTFNSGKTNVEGVDVKLQPDDDELASSMFSYAVQFVDKNQYMPLAQGLSKKFWDGDWTLQFILRPDKDGVVANLPGRMKLTLKADRLYLGSSTNSEHSIKLNAMTFQGNYVMLKHTDEGYQLGYITLDENDKAVINWTTSVSDTDMASSAGSATGDAQNAILYFGSNKACLNEQSFTGCVDEIRLWEDALSDKSIADTYNRYLSGNEKGLMAYYTFDSGVGEYAFDSSHPSGNWNNRHSELPTEETERPIVTSKFVPEADMLTYRGITDKNGEYTISGIPFEGEGTNWNIVPALGAHDFSPTSSRRLVSLSTLVHSGIDFTDISSFKVSGRVYYENTNIPVQGCNITIDGALVYEGSDAAETNANGEFCVDVPIGTHTLAMSMDGHTFTDSLTMYFNKQVKDLWFYDQTKSVVAGRVCGGEMQYEQPLGLAQSKNNIGTAYITLKPTNDNYYFTAETDRNNLYVVPSTTQIDYKNALEYGNNSWAHTGQAASETEMGDANRIYIKTDSLTGEFAVCLPPMRYELIDITIPSADEAINARLRQSLGYLDARNTAQEMTDSAWTGQTTTGDKVYKQFTYNNTCKIMITTPAVFEVWQTDDDANFFGEDSVTYVGNDGKEHMMAAYENGNYVIGADGSEKRPVFTQFESYTLYLQASQKYLNKDNKSEILEDVMPLRNKPVTINNGMAYENYWYVDENGNTSFSETEGTDCELDSLGRGVYKFKVGAPNTVSPYEESLSMVLDKDLAEFNLTGVVLGTVSYGNSFITKGPSILSMILRDPPGSKSYATWKAGSTTVVGYTRTQREEVGNGENSEVNLGYVVKDENGFQYGAQATERNDEVWYSGDNTANGFTLTATTQFDISTSSAAEFDGPDADLFIGISENIVSGNGKQVTIVSPAVSGQGAQLGVKEVKTSGFSFGTDFAYSQYQIKNSVIPNLLAERRSLIEDPAAVPADNKSHYVLKDMDFKEWQTMTDEEKDAWLDKGLEHGYEIKGLEQFMTDSVELYRLWAEDWKNVLRGNEKAKVDAYTSNDHLITNYTFDAGSTQTITTSTSEMKVVDDHTDISGMNEDVHLGVKGYVGVGDAKLEWHRTALKRTETRNYTNNTEQEVLSFTLADNDANDILTVDRMTAPDGFSDIFRTRAGQTSAFWAPQYVTEYYQPGTEIMAPTLMVNKPRLELVDPTQQIVSNVRRGTSASIQFRLINDSEAKCNGYYRLGINAEENTNGAKCSFNGTVLNNDGVLVWLEYGKPQVVTVSVDEPQNPVDGTYRLTFFLIDDKQTRITGPMNIYPSEVPVTVQFTKSSSEIALTADKTIINAESIRTGNGKVHFTLSDYDVKMENLLYIDLQQWDGTMFVSLGDSARWEKKDGLEESEAYVLDLSDINTFPDGEYRFRARTVSNYGEGNVEAYSDEMVILKDVSAPQPASNLMPIRGILSNDNEISVEFNEDIVGDIRKDTNVVLYSELVNNTSARETSVFFNGGDNLVSTDVPTSALQEGTARSFNLWIKWMGGEGTILSLGGTRNANRFGIDEDGHFVIYSSKNSLTSTNTFERNKWTFLSLIIDDTAPDTPTSITASYITEDGKDVVWLLGDKDGGEQLDGLTTSAALFVLGKGFHGNIQDLSLWDGVRDMDKSNNEKSQTKTRFTKDLIAYWPLNEGYGKMSKEVVSEQNMYLSSENMWNIDNRNYSMRLEKGQKAQLIFSNLNTNYNEDYLVQAWFNVDKSLLDSGSTQTDTLVSYPSTGPEAATCFVIPRKTGNLVMKCRKDSIILGNRNVADGYWHQLSFMVKKSENGNATVYLDGDNVGQIAAKKVDAMQGLLFLGDTSGFSGYFDEIRIWNGLQNSQMISENLNKRYSTTDCPVAAYFPFEVSGRNQTVDFTLANYGNMKADGDTVRLAVTDPNVPLSQLAITPETEMVAPLKNAPTLVTRDFSIVNSERKIKINIDEKEIKDVQGTTVTALVRGLRDKAGNTIQDIRWSFLVEMNDIEWGDEIYTQDYNPDTQGNLVGIGDIVNNTGIEQSWRIENVPYWMELSSYGGVLKPGEKLTIIINAKENIPIGTNIGILSLVDGKGIYHKQQYSINHIPNSPDWVVNPLYSQVMTVTGQVRINSIIQENSLNKLAAFNESGDCVGVVTPEYIREKNSYYYTMMIYGNEDYIGKNVTFKFYDASTGTYYASVEPSEPIVFGGDYSNIGSIEAPIYWDTTGMIEQIINMSEGWNWISFNIREEGTIDEIFSNPQPSPIYEEVKDKNNFARYYNGKWEYDDDFGTVTHGRMYKVKTVADATISRIGTPINDYGSRISIVGMKNGMPGWSWIGANISTNMALTTAMGGLTSAPKTGDIIKNFEQFAEYTTSGWIGKLNTIIPGKGYMYMSNDESSKYLIYPLSSASAPKSAVRLTSGQDEDQYAEYAGSATVIAAVESDGIRMNGCTILAVDADGNVHGCKTVSDKDDRHLAYLVVHGNDPETINFKVVFGEGEKAQTFESATTLGYSDGLQSGTSDNPFVIHIAGADAITSISTSDSADTLYDLSGRPVPAAATLSRGIYIRNNQKQFVR